MSDTPLRDQVLQTSSGQTEPAFVPHAGTYAGLRGATRQSGKNWNDAGLIVWVPDDAKPGKRLVDVAATDRRRADQQNPLKRHAPAPVTGRSSPTAAPPHPQPKDPAPAEAGPDLFTKSPARRPLARDRDAGGGASGADASAGAPLELQDAQQRRASDLTEEGKAYDNELKFLKLAKLKGALVDREDRQAAEVLRARRIRDRLRQLPNALAEELNPADPARAQRILKREIDATLNALADELAAAARENAGGDIEDDDADADPAPAPEHADA